TLAGLDTELTAIYAALADISAVATSIANVNTVAGLDTEVTTLAALDTELAAIYAALSDLQAAAADLPSLAAKLNKDGSNVGDDTAKSAFLQAIGVPLRGHIYGLTLSNNTTDATNDIDIAAGEAASDGSDPVLMVLASALTKRLD